VSNKDNKKKSNKKLAIIIILSILIILVLGVVYGYNYVKEKVYVDKKPSNAQELSEQGEIQEDVVEYKEVWGITNILLIGADERDSENGSRSDSMIIASIDNNNKKIKLTSLYRDTFVSIPGYGENRINAAYELGGPELLLQTIKDTYDISIDKYVIIDFKGFETVIDKIGGLDIEIKDDQIEELNKYIGETTGGNDCPITEPGLQHLNGKQALSYARIRKNVGDDFERAERQREVILKVVEKFKDTKPIKYLGIMNSMLDYIEMNIEPMEALDLAYTVYKFPSLQTEQLSIPVQEYVVDREIEGIGSVLVMDQYENARILQELIFEDKMPNLEGNQSEETQLEESEVQETE
jgi:LCP family protein required for cell wall assembly